MHPDAKVANLHPLEQKLLMDAYFTTTEKESTGYRFSEVLVLKYASALCIPPCKQYNDVMWPDGIHMFRDAVLVSDSTYRPCGLG